MKFSLTALLWLFALVAAAMATLGAMGGLAVAACVLLTWSVVGWRESSGCVTFGVISLIALCLLLPVVGSTREAIHQGLCMSNTKQLAFALHNYQDKQSKTFPPAYLTDDDGKPMHSWRVLLLPYLEEQALYDQYDFNEPWNGPNNSKLADQMPDVYRCPACEDCRGVCGLPWELPPGDCPSYHLAADPAAGTHVTSGGTFAEITDGSSNTIMLIECHDRHVNWLEPDFYSLAEAVELLSSRDALRHPTRSDSFWTTAFCGAGGHIGWFDGRIGFHGPFTPEGAEACLTASGGEPRAGELRNSIKAYRGPSIHVVRWDRVALMAVFVALALAPKWWRRSATEETTAGDRSAQSTTTHGGEA